MKKTLVNFVLDETGSMNKVMQETISGFNEYLDTLKPHGKTVRMTLTKFNSKGINTAYVNTPIKDIAYLSNKNYHPDELTPLYDAIASSIKAVEKELGKKSGAPAVLFVILTDGLENASTEYTRSKIFDLIKEKENAGWTFAYLGSNQDAWEEGGKMGVPGASTHTYSGDSYGTMTAFATVCAATDDYLRNGSKSTTGYFAETNIGKVDKFYRSIESRLSKKEDNAD